MREKDDLLCDLAEYYQVYDLRALPVRTLAALSCGLPEDSRTMRRISGQKLTTTQTLLAACCDSLAMLVWLNSSDGAKNINRPRGILSALNEEEKEKPLVYADGAAFMAAWEKLAGGE